MRMRTILEPQTAADWQDAVDVAALYRILDGARRSGAIAGGPSISVARCDQLLARGAARGYAPTNAGLAQRLESWARGAW